MAKKKAPDEAEEERQSAETAMQRAQAQLGTLAKRGLDVSALEQKLESAQLNFGAREYHEAEIAAGEVIVLAKATAEMARMSTNVAKQEDAQRRQIAEAVRAELSRSLPKSPALDEYVKGRLADLLPEFVGADEFQQAVLGIADSTYQALSEENPAVSPEELGGKLASLEEQVLAEAADATRSSVTSLLASADLTDKIREISSRVAVEETATFPKTVDVEEIAKRVTREALANLLDTFAASEDLGTLETAIKEDVANRLARVPSDEDVRNMIQEAVAQAAAPINSSIEAFRSEILTEGAVETIASGVVDEAVRTALAAAVSHDDLQALAQSVSEEVEKRLSALPSPEELSHAAAEAAQQEAGAVAEELRSEMAALTSRVEQVAGRVAVGPEELDEAKAAMHDQAASFAAELREEVEAATQAEADARQQLAQAVAGLEETSGALTERVADLAPAGDLESVRQDVASLKEGLASLASIEERLGAMVAGEELAERVRETVQPMIDGVSSAVPTEEAIRTLALEVTEGITNQIPRVDGDALEERILEKVAPIVGALVGSDQFTSNINMLVGQRIEDTIDSRGLLTQDAADRVVSERLKALAKKLATKEDITALRKSALGKSKEADIDTAVAALRDELTQGDLVPSVERVREMIVEAIQDRLASVPGRDEIESLVSERVAGLPQEAGLNEGAVDDKLAALRSELEATIREAAVAQAAGVDEDALKEQLGALKDDVLAAAREAAPAAGIDEAALDERVSALREELVAEAKKAAPAEGGGGGVTEEDLDAHFNAFKFELLGDIKTTVLADEEFRSTVVGEAVAEQLAEFYHRLPKSKPLQEVIAKAVAGAGAGGGAGADPEAVKAMVNEAVQAAGGGAGVDPEAVKAMVNEAVQAAGGGAGVDPEAVKAMVNEAVQAAGGAAPDPEAVKAMAQEAVSAYLAENPPSGGGEVDPDTLSQAVQSELMGFFTDPEYVKSILPMPEQLDMETVEKIATRAGNQAVVSIFDSDEFAKRVLRVAGGGGGEGGEVTGQEIKGALVEFLESDLFREKIQQVLAESGAAVGEGGLEAAGAAELQIKAAADVIREDLGTRMAKVEEALPAIVERVAKEKGLGGGLDEKVLDEKVSSLVADKTLGDKLDASVLQAEVTKAIPDAMQQIANSDEFKEALDDKFKIILKYLKDEIIPKQVKKILEGGGKKKKS